MESIAKRFASSSLMIWILLVIIGIYFLYPLRKSIRFGIDLVGGSYLTLEVKTDVAIEAELVRRLQSIDAKCKRERINIVSKNVQNNAIILTFENPQQTQEAARIIKSDERELTQSVERNSITLNFSDAMEKRIKEDAVLRNIEVLRTRLDRFSVAEISIAKQGDKEIIIELPDVTNPQEAKEMIGRAALLEFKLVEKVGSNEQELLLEYDGELPDDLQILPGEREHGRTHYYYVVQKYAKVTGNMLSDARPGLGGKTGVEPVVNFSFNEEGADKFYELTSKNYNRQLAIVLDGEVISAPRIESAIRNSGQITGNFTTQSAKQLAYLLKSGSFVAPVTFEEERQIGPSLGAESIKHGLYSCLGGFGLVFLFSVYYYKLSGLLAFLALVYNLILILMGLAWLHATLTLPGIAGMTLTIGMAIDASILIYERIKEELAKGSSIKNAVDTGFSGAMSVILDGNITTFIIGIVLYHLGSGPIQGFAVTLMLGIIATLIATLFFLKSFFKFILSNFSIQKLSI